MSSANNLRHVTVVGGPGAMGRHAVRKMSTFDQIAKIVLADIDVEKASRFAAEIGDKAEAAQLDVRDDDRLNELFSQTQIVVNAMGPFVTFGEGILKAAIRNGCDYIDIDDDWEATVAALKLNDAAKDADVTALIGVGISPGVTNLLAQLASRELDTVERIYTGWRMAGTGTTFEPEYDVKGAAGAAVAHWILQCSGKVQSWRDGEQAMVNPLEKIDINFPEFGVQQVRTLGHPEPVTLPGAFPGLQESANVMSGPSWLFDALGEITEKFERNEIDLETAVAAVGDIERPADPAATPRDPLPGSWALVEGTKDGEVRTVHAYLTAIPPFQMGGGTGYALAAGLQMMLEDQVDQVGVVSPEEALDPIEYFNRFARMTDPVKTDVNDLIRLVSHVAPALANDS